MSKELVPPVLANWINQGDLEALQKYAFFGLPYEEVIQMFRNHEQRLQKAEAEVFRLSMAMLKDDGK